MIIYTDGSCIQNPGPGGYGAVLKHADGRERELAGGFRLTTNNRMELMAVIKALEALQGDRYTTVAIYSDSRIMVDAFQKNWIDSWIAKNWVKSDKKSVQNRDLWEKLLPLVKRHSAKFEWVRAHANIPDNERADRLAFQQANQPNNPSDKVYEQKVSEQQPNLTHIDREGAASMVNIGKKKDSNRLAIATADIIMQPTTLRLIQAGGVTKGNVVATARIAAINAAKRTDELIPLCHQIPLNGVQVKFDNRSKGDGLIITVEVTATWKTGVEMEALLAASVAALTVYDMCKAVDKTMYVAQLKLVKKTKDVQ